VPGSERDDQIAMTRRQRARRHDQPAIRGARERRDGAVDFAGIAHVDRAQLHPQRGRHGLSGGELPDPGGDGRIPKDRRPRHAGRDLFEQLQPFSAHAVFVNRESSRVAARPRQADDESGADRIDDLHEHDRHGAGRLQQRRRGYGASSSHEDVRRERGQFRRVSANVVGVGRGPASVDPHIATVGPA
jgi:hypothetical protein